MRPSEIEARGTALSPHYLFRYVFETPSALRVPALLASKGTIPGSGKGQ